LCGENALERRVTLDLRRIGSVGQPVRRERFFLVKRGKKPRQSLGKGVFASPRRKARTG
jgi:hypothetical protein